jgi:sensor c-di-GMP phosphodiesterase-like protein
MHGGTMSSKPANLADQHDQRLNPDSPLASSPVGMPALPNARELLVLVALTTAGALLGWWWSNKMAEGAVERHIEQSTARVLERLDDIIFEAHRVFAAIEGTDEGHCTPAQLQTMRTYLFEARYLRDIGGTRGYSLYCSAALGILSEPYHSSPPPIRLADGTGLRTDRSVLASERLRTVVIEYGNFNALIDSRQVSDLITGLDRAHLELAVDDPRQRDWHPFSLLTRPEGGESSRRLARRVQCSDQTGLCIRIRTESPVDAELGSQAYLVGSLGAVLGASLFLIGANLRRQRNTPDRALERAIRGHLIQPRYQPIVRLPGGELAGFEALARWRDEHGRPVPTDRFIDLAERNGMISEISHLMIQAIGSEVGGWLAAHPQLSVTINISPEEFGDPSLITLIDEELIKRGIQPSQIVLEITERTMIETTAAQAIIERLNHMGLRLYADDFGVGYCGLAYLNELDIHGVKISQQLTAAVATDSPKASLVPRVTEMARGLNLDVVIEGVETERQREALRPLEPIQVQGWLFSHELTAADLMRFFDDHQLRRRPDHLPS